MKTFFNSNRIKLAEKLSRGDLVVLFSGAAPRSTADAYYSFMPNKNFYYFTGCEAQHFIFAGLKTADDFETVLFIEKPDYDIEKWIGRKLSAEKAREKSGIENVQFLEGFNGWISRTVYGNKVKRLFLDLERMDWEGDDTTASKYAGEFTKRYPFVDIQTIHPIAGDLRVIKSDYEVERIRTAIGWTNDGLDAIMKVLKPGVYEYQLEATFAHSIRMNGADGCSFPTIAASGEDGVILHYVDNQKAIADGSLVLLDLGAQAEQYAADITRTYPANGKFSPRQKEIYNIVLGAQRAVIDAIAPGVPYENLNVICQQYFIKELKRINLIQTDSELGQYYYHGVSHHLGLDVHDIGPRQTDLLPGMVVTVEPGLYIAEEGIGIRIEEDVLVTEAGCEVLSKDIPKTVEEIEAFMSKF